MDASFVPIIITVGGVVIGFVLGVVILIAVLQLFTIEKHLAEIKAEIKHHRRLSEIKEKGEAPTSS